MFYTADNQLYSFILNSNSREVFPVLDEEYGITINSEPVGMSLRIFNGSFDEDYMLFSLENGLLVYSSRLLPVMVSTCPQFVSMVQIYDLLWAIKEGDRNVIIYNENLNPTQWNSSDFEIDLSQYGALIKLISFDDYLYVFREFGICKISMYSPQKFSVSNIYTSSAKIFADTIIICGDEIVFFAEDGLYSFNGSSVKRLTFGFEKLVKSNKQKPSATYFNDVYYLALKLDFDDEKTIGCEANENGFVNNALVCIDLHTKKYSITRGVDIYSLTPIFTSDYSTVLACFNGQYCNMIGAISQTGTNFSYFFFFWAC